MWKYIYLFRSAERVYLRVCLHTYHLRFIPEGVADASQILFRDARVLPKLLSYE
jgi:hypothetical protein